MLYLKDRETTTPTRTWIKSCNGRKGKLESETTSFEIHLIPITYTKDEIKDPDLTWTSQFIHTWTSQFIHTKDECIALVKEEMFSILGVNSFYVSIDEESVDVWILIPDRDTNLINRIIDKENMIIDRFITDGQTKYLFEFHVLYQCQANEAEIIPTSSIKISKSA